jgi:hypothetical protein
MGATGRYEHPARHALSIESQLLAIGSGFVVLILIAALFVAIQNRRRRRNSSREFHSPLIQSFNGSRQKFRATSRNFGSSSSNGGSPSPPILSSPGSDSSSSPQCTPMTPYASFGNESQQHHTKISDDRGSISLSLNYDQATKILQISVIACHNLPELQQQNGQCTLNPYVKLRILPDNQHRVKTRVLRNTRNPFFDEQFTMYGITREQLQTYTLHLAVLASDRYSRDTVLGETFLGLGEAGRQDINHNENKTLELKLYPRPAYTDVRAQLFMSIAMNQLTNSINIAILKMKDLPNDERIGQIDSYVKVYMLLNGQRVAKHKTHVKKRSIEPIFNESFAFDLPSMIGDSKMRSGDQLLDTISFEIQVLNHNGVTRNELVGHCLIGKDSKHWQAVREQPGQQVVEWHRVVQSE